jgi:hypothetical protein
MGNFSYNDNCPNCGWEHAIHVDESRASEGVPDEWGYCLRCGYNWGYYNDEEQEDYSYISTLRDLNQQRVSMHMDYVNDGHGEDSPFEPPIQYSPAQYEQVLSDYTLEHYIDKDTFPEGHNIFDGEGHEHHEHGHHHHEDEIDPDELIYLIDRLAAFAVDYTDSGGFGGEPMGSETDEKRGLIVDTILYVEGSIELNIINDMERNPLSLRFSWTDNDFSPILYLPPPEFMAKHPDEIMEHDH